MTSLKNMLAAASAVLALAVALPSQATPVAYGGTLSNLGEPAAAAGSLGTGSVIVILDADAFTMEVHATFSGLSGNTTASHIHCCTAVAGTGSAGVATGVPTFPGFPLGVRAGTYDHLFDMTLASSYNPAFITANGGVASAFSVFAAAMDAGNTYFNIHTTVSPGGEIRTFLNRVPEPGSLALMLAGLGAMGFAARRRHL